MVAICLILCFIKSCESAFEKDPQKFTRRSSDFKNQQKVRPPQRVELSDLVVASISVLG